MILDENESVNDAPLIKLRTALILGLIIAGIAALWLWGGSLLGSLMPKSNTATSSSLVTFGLQMQIIFVISCLTAAGLIWLTFRRTYEFIPWTCLCIALHLLLGLLSWKLVNSVILFFFPNGMWEWLNNVINASVVTFWCWSFLKSFSLKVVKDQHIGQLVVLNWYVPWGRNIPAGPVCLLLPFKALARVIAMSVVTVTEHMTEQPKGADKEKKSIVGVPIQAGSLDHEFQAWFQVMFEYRPSDTRESLLREAKVNTLRNIIKEAITTAVTIGEGEGYDDVDDLRKHKSKISKTAFDDAAKKFDALGKKLVSITVVEVESNPEVLKGRVELEAAQLIEKVQTLDADKLRIRARQIFDDAVAAGSPISYERALNMAQVQEGKRRATDLNVRGNRSGRTIIGTGRGGDHDDY